MNVLGVGLALMALARVRALLDRREEQALTKLDRKRVV